MLVMSRKLGEKIQIGEDVEVTIVRLGADAVRIGVEAPGEVRIIRAELVPIEELPPLAAQIENKKVPRAEPGCGGAVT